MAELCRDCTEKACLFADSVHLAGSECFKPNIKYALTVGGMCAYIGTKAKCNEAFDILVDYYKYDQWAPSLDVVEQVTVGYEQEYIEKALDPTTDFKYGH